jgi:hypothetical protein
MADPKCKSTNPDALDDGYRSRREVAQNDIVPVKGRPTDASEMAKRWFKSQKFMGPYHKAAARLGSRSHSLLCAPGKWGRKRRNKSCSITSNSSASSEKTRRSGKTVATARTSPCCPSRRNSRGRTRTKSGSPKPNGTVSWLYGIQPVRQFERA